MNKKSVLIFTFLGLFFAFSFLHAQSSVSISDPLGIGNNPEGIKILLLRIADGIGKIIASIGTIMIIVSGIMFLLSAGDPTKMQTAKKALLYAIIGLAVGVSATAIADTVIEILK